MVRAKNRTFVLERKTGGESPAAGLEAKGLEGIFLQENRGIEEWQLNPWSSFQF